MKRRMLAFLLLLLFALTASAGAVSLYVDTDLIQTDVPLAARPFGGAGSPAVVFEYVPCRQRRVRAVKDQAVRRSAERGLSLIHI